ncbi:MAG TPA: DUF222 domain-containing protein, partial [Streptosporangiaceae bacterium]
MEALHSGVSSAGLVELQSAVSAYLEQDPDRLSDADQLTELRALEQLSRQLHAAMIAQVASVQRRGLAARLGPASTKDLLMSMLRISPSDAAGRVAAAGALCAQVSVSGAPLPVLLPAQLPAEEFAHAATDGVVSGEQVGIIVRTMNELPAQLPAEEFAQAEQILVRAAGHLGPKDLRNVRTRLLATIDPDGAQPSEEQQRARRSLVMRLGADGMLSGRFQLSAGQGAKVMAVLHGHAAPAPAEDGSPDPRSSPQRLADSLEDLCDLALRAGRITPAGPRVALNITMTAEQYNTYTAATTDGGATTAADASIANAPTTSADAARPLHGATTGDATSRAATSGAATSGAATTGVGSHGAAPSGAATTSAATTSAATTGPAIASASDATSRAATSGGALTSARSHGLAETSYGQLLPVGTALGLCREASLAFIVQDSHGAVLNYRRTRR